MTAKINSRQFANFASRLHLVFSAPAANHRLGVMPFPFRVFRVFRGLNFGFHHSRKLAIPADHRLRVKTCFRFPAFRFFSPSVPICGQKFGFLLCASVPLWLKFPPPKP
jgi:hypothetical protein